jgi:DNA-binding GntR family transcriptional regulator
LERLTLADRAYNEIRRRILTRSLAQGERLTIAALADELNVSPTPVREALTRLEKAGLLSTEPYAGWRVRTFSIQEVADIYELRLVLEEHSLRLFVQHASDQDLARLNEILDGEEQATLAGDDVRRARLSDDFHVAIAEASGNHLLAEFIRTALDRGQVLWLASHGGRPKAVIEDTIWPRSRNADHRKLLRALEQRSVEQAMSVLRPHLASAMAFLTQELAKECVPDDGGDPKE